MPLLLPVLLLDTEPSLDSLRVTPPAGGTGDGGGRGPPRSLTALAALLRDTLTGEMPSAQILSILKTHQCEAWVPLKEHAACCSSQT